ncbi:uncharacterized protein EI90DRAFT_3055688 [Cantharellus anzutake]|uniref:uncharacterized protein n=1 Tax=Cantharellus anzutake TaxID=1750568 RepID=UPI001903B7B3|nr:uncharacterized protein EI90DRAFT_3055688 [Cantharellus anzutake]KAF8331865.1 hypothetical protein EI90DRAFT_3055688 [Cantharellus anzutake]
MFKKPLHVKPSAPIKSSECRRLRAEIVSKYITGAGGDASDQSLQLVPDGLRSSRFSVLSRDHFGVLYTSSDNIPLWFTLEKSNDLIPTLYTLWKFEILPILTTPPTAIEKILGGADLMIPGIIENHEDGNIPSIPLNGFVAVAPARSRVPLAIGRMAINTDEVRRESKGKAVYILHTHKDSLWGLGPDNAVLLSAPRIDGVEVHSSSGMSDRAPAPERNIAVNMEDLSVEEQNLPSNGTAPEVEQITPEEADAILRTALVQAITTISKSSTVHFPISSSAFYSTHILPSRPAPPLSDQSSAPPDLIRRSSFKKLTRFLQHAEKISLLKLKDMKGNLNVVSLNANHPDVLAHRPYRTIADAEAQEAREEKAAKEEAERVQPMIIEELFKPAGPTRDFVEKASERTDGLYTTGDLKTFIDTYIAANGLIHPRERGYVTVDVVLREILLNKNEDAEFLKREELVPRLKNAMQKWHSVKVPGEEPRLRKGELKPIVVMTKLRSGRKACTLITGFETYLIPPEFLTEELRKSCAGATSVTELPGKAGKEVMVQGKHINMVMETLISRGVPKRCIEVRDTMKSKK